MFSPASRKQSKLRLAICGPSGSGKTYSSLQIASGIAGDGAIAVIDTERGSASLYSGMVPFDVCELHPPFEPARYVSALEEAAQGEYAVVIIDSLSHAWEGEGGVLDMHDKATKAQRSANSYVAWRHVTPKHNELVNAILQSPIHVIATLRTKTAYEVQDNERGRKMPVKIGTKPIQREGIEYEFTTVFDMSCEQVATAGKDRTGLFIDSPHTPTKETGERLLAWLETGEDATPSADAYLDQLELDVANAIAEGQIDLCRNLCSQGQATAKRTGTKAQQERMQKIVDDAAKRIQEKNK